jgi:predicted Zn-dependent protease
MLLMEAESDALHRLGRYEEAMVIAQYCLKTRTGHPERFPDGGKVPFTSYFSLAQSMQLVGHLDQAESMLHKAMGVLESEGKELHPSVVHVLGALEEVYRRQGRKKAAGAMAKKVRKLVPQVFPQDHPEYKNYMG